MKKQSIVMLSFMAQGHIIPLLTLAHKIERRGQYDIIFVNTPLNIRNLRRSLPATSTIRFLEIPFNSSDHGLPPDCENTDVLPYTLSIRLYQASTTLEPAFRSLLADLVKSSSPPLCVVADFMYGWSAEVTHEFGLFHAFFSCTSVYGLACYHTIWLNLPHRKTESPEFTLPDFPEAKEFHVTQLCWNVMQADGNDPWSLFQHKNLGALSNTDAFLFNSIGEIEQAGLDYFRRMLDRPVWCVGPLLHLGDNRYRAGKQDGISRDQCVEWLNSKPPNSVLYVAFGSMNNIAASQMMQLAKVLDESKVNFIWVVRPPVGFDITGRFRAEEWLPEGFTKRVVEDEKRGLVVAHWAPQAEILSHNSVGGYLTHCGWNSVTEALRGGMPLLVWPLASEQAYIAKFLVEIGVAVEVARWTTSDIRSEDMVEKIKMVMMVKDESNDKGKEMRKRAGELKEMIKEVTSDDDEGLKGYSVKAIDEFLDAALLFKEKKSGE